MDVVSLTGVCTRGRRADDVGAELAFPFDVADEFGSRLCPNTKPGTHNEKRISATSAKENLFFTENLTNLSDRTEGKERNGELEIAPPTTDSAILTDADKAGKVALVILKRIKRRVAERCAWLMPIASGAPDPLPVPVR